ncbi:MAG: TonB-dependent siderophore receptor [Cyanobacteria bacterium P01_G01_bin.54]
MIGKRVGCAALTLGIGTVQLLAMEPVLAQTLGTEVSPSSVSPHESGDRAPKSWARWQELSQPATSLAEWQAQLNQGDAAIAPVTDVRLERRNDRLEIVLETAQEDRLQVDATQFRVEGDRLLATIGNAKLVLPDGETFIAENPTADIARVAVNPGENNTITVTVTGNNGPPTTPITLKTGFFAYSLNPDQNTNALRILVTGDQEDYFEPRASSATRTDAPLLETPASIQVVPREVLEDQQVIRIEEALNNVSGVTFAGTFANTSANFNIRGFDAPTLRNGFREFGGFTGISPSTTNIERVEVLKGPASILYGEIEPGGLINIVTKQPLAEPTHTITLQAGNRGIFQPQIDFSGPLSEDGRVRYRLNASYFHDDGFTDYDQDYERTFIAPVIAVELDDRTQITFNAEYADDRYPFDVGIAALGTGVVDIPFDRILAEPDDFIESQFLRFGYTLEHEFNDSLTIRNAFEYTDRDLVNEGFLPLAFDEDTGIVTRNPARQELDTQNLSLQTSLIGKFDIGSTQHTLVAGIDLNHTNDVELTGFDIFTAALLDIFNPEYGTAGTVAADLPIFFDSRIATDRLGLYLQDQIRFSEELIVLAGLRYDRVGRYTTNNPTAFDLEGSEDVRTDTALIPRFGVVYQPIDNLSLFASYSQSFEPNFGTTSSGESLDPERGEGFEFGVKAELLDGDLFVNLAYFDITLQNISTQDPNDPTGTFNVATGEQRSRGVELDVVGEILPGWNIIASYAHIDAEVTEDNTVTVGNRLFNTPQNSASLWTTYEVQSGDLQGLGLGVGFNFVGEREGDLANSFQVDSYFLTNAAIFYKRDNWRFALNAKNIFDVDHITATNNLRESSIEPGAPFTIVGSISVEF